MRRYPLARAASLDRRPRGVTRTRAVRALRHPGNWVQLAKFCVVGASGYLVNLAVYALLLEVADLHYLAAGACSFVVAAANNYYWNRHWTFRRQRGAPLLPGDPLPDRLPGRAGREPRDPPPARRRRPGQDPGPGDRDPARDAAELRRQQALVLSALALRARAFTETPVSPWPLPLVSRSAPPELRPGQARAPRQADSHWRRSLRSADAAGRARRARRQRRRDRPGCGRRRRPAVVHGHARARAVPFDAEAGEADAHASRARSRASSPPGKVHDWVGRYPKSSLVTEGDFDDLTRAWTVMVWSGPGGRDRDGPRRRPHGRGHRGDGRGRRWRGRWPGASTGAFGGKEINSWPVWLALQPRLPRRTRRPAAAASRCATSTCSRCSRSPSRSGSSTTAWIFTQRAARLPGLVYLIVRAHLDRMPRPDAARVDARLARLAARRRDRVHARVPDRPQPLATRT